MIKRVIIAAVCALSISASAKEMSVQVREGQMRERPSFLGKTVLPLDYGLRVEVLSQRGTWYQIRLGQTDGWIHQSALTKKSIKLTAGDGDLATGASTSEMALAGKGFSQQVENEYKKQNNAANFAAVDFVQNIDIPDEEIVTFVEEGDLHPSEGGTP